MATHCTTRLHYIRKGCLQTGWRRDNHSEYGKLLVRCGKTHARLPFRLHLTKLPLTTRMACLGPHTTAAGQRNTQQSEGPGGVQTLPPWFQTEAAALPVPLRV